MKTKMIVLILPLMVMLSCEKEHGCKGHHEDEKEINVNELPKAVTESIQTQFTGAQLLEADEITKKDGSKTYDVEINHNSQKMEVMYDAAGKYLGTEKDDEDED